MWCGYQKLGNCFCLTVFVDSSFMPWFYATQHTDRETSIPKGIDTLIFNDLQPQNE